MADVQRALELAMTIAALDTRARLRAWARNGRWRPRGLLKDPPQSSLDALKRLKAKP
jgi:hypothetical protein